MTLLADGGGTKRCFRELPGLAVVGDGHGLGFGWLELNFPLRAPARQSINTLLHGLRVIGDIVSGGQAVI